jgi:hypothetical protein
LFTTAQVQSPAIGPTALLRSPIESVVTITTAFMADSSLQVFLSLGQALVGRLPMLSMAAYTNF